VTATVTEPATIGRPTLSSERAREMGQASGRARQRLTLARLERELTLDTPDAINRSCQLIVHWGVLGLIAGTTVNGCIRGCEVALKSLDSQDLFATIEQLRADVQRLADERDQLAEQLQLAARRTA